MVPPRGLDVTTRNGSCPSLIEDIAGTWLAQALPHAKRVWTDRTAVMQSMRKQGITLAKIGEALGVSAERVRQVLLENEPVDA